MKFNLDKILARIPSENRYQAIQILLDQEIRETLNDRGFELEDYDHVKEIIMESLNDDCQGLVRVRNLMTGEMVAIDAKTPWSCRPDSETYWSS